VLFRAQKNAQIRSSFNGGGCWLGEKESVTRAAVLISNLTTIFSGCSFTAVVHLQRFLANNRGKLSSGFLLTTALNPFTMIFN
jgi:hypothetical protein